LAADRAKQRFTVIKRVLPLFVLDDFPVISVRNLTAAFTLTSFKLHRFS